MEYGIIDYYEREREWIANTSRKEKNRLLATNGKSGPLSGLYENLIDDQDDLQVASLADHMSTT